MVRNWESSQGGESSSALLQGPFVFFGIYLRAGVHHPLVRVFISDKFFLILCCSSSSFSPYPSQNNNDNNGNNTINHHPCFECLPIARHRAEHFVRTLLTLAHGGLATPHKEGIILTGEETETRESQETGSVMHSLDHCGLCLRK